MNLSMIYTGKCKNAKHDMLRAIVLEDGTQEVFYFLLFLQVLLD